MTPKGITAEGDRVAVEAESYGETASGKIYNNLYHFLFEVRGGKIQAVREYLAPCMPKKSWWISNGYYLVTGACVPGNPGGGGARRTDKQTLPALGI
jgi:hypothetical protein